MTDRKKCVRCGDPVGRGCSKHCAKCSHKAATPGICSRCYGPKPAQKGREYCDECRDLEKWKSNRLKALRRRKTCSDCHGPKPPGHGRIWCPACVKRRRKERAAVQPVRVCADCNKPVGKRRMYCDECRDLRAWEAAERKKAKAKEWRATTPLSKRPRKRKAKHKSEPMVPVLQLGEALYRCGLRAAGLRLADCAEGGTHGHKEVCERAGLKERTVFGWRCGERDNTELSSATDVMSRVDLLWWDVWNPDTVRKHAFKVVVYKNVKPNPTVPLGPWNDETRVQWDEHPKKMAPVGFKRIKLESKRYVDLGPDKAELRRIARTFEGSKPRRAAA